MTDATPLVLIPGTLCDAGVFADQVANLPGDIQVADITTGNTIEQIAAAVLADAPPTFGVVGLSLGGIVAAEMMFQQPSRILGIALVDTNLDAPQHAQNETRQRWISETRAGNFAQIVTDELVTPLTAFPELHGSLIFDMAMRVGPEAFLRQNEALLVRHDRRVTLANSLGEHPVPVLIVSGDLDSVTPTTLHDDLAQRLTSGTAESSVTPSPLAVQHEVLADAGHLTSIDQPAALTRVLQGWLETWATKKPIQEGKQHEYNIA